MPYTANVCHDETARVWYVRDSDIPGLHAEAATLDDLVAVIEDVVPDLVAARPEAGGVLPTISVCVQHLVTARRERAA